MTFFLKNKIPDFKIFDRNWAVVHISNVPCFWDKQAAGPLLPTKASIRAFCKSYLFRSPLSGEYPDVVALVCPWHELDARGLVVVLHGRLDQASVAGCKRRAKKKNMFIQRIRKV